MKRIVFIVFVLIGAGIPLVFLPSLNLITELPKAAIFRILTLLAAVLFLFNYLRIGHFNWLKIDKKLWIALILFVFINLLALAFSIAPHVSFWGSYERQQGVLQLLHYIVFFLLFISFFDKEDARKFIKCCCYAAVFVASIAILQNFLSFLTSYWETDVLKGRIAIGTLGHPNFLASYLLMMFPFVMIDFFENKSFSRKAFWGFSALLILVAIFLTRSREAYIGLFAMSVFASIYYKRALAVFPIMAVCTVLLINLYPTSQTIHSNAFLRRLVITNDLINSEPRFAIWPAAVQQFLDRPLLGYGQEVFAESFTKYTPTKLLRIEAFRKVADRAHNEILDVLSSIGLLGLISYLIFFAMLIHLAVKKMTDPLIIGVLAAFIGLFVSNIFGFSATTNNVLWWALAAVIVVFSGEKSMVKISCKKLLCRFFIVLLIGLSIFTGINPLIADYHFAKANLYSSGLLHFYALEEFKKAVVYNPREAHYFLRAAEYAMIAAKNTDDGYYKNILTIQAEFYLEGAENLLGSNFSQILFLKGKFYNLLNDNNLASDFFESANQKAPKNPDYLIHWAKVLADQGKYSKSLEVYEEFLEISPYWKDAFVIENYDMENRELFRLFFKHTIDFPKILENVSAVAELAGNSEKVREYENYAQKIRNVMKKFVNN